MDDLLKGIEILIKESGEEKEEKEETGEECSLEKCGLDKLIHEEEVAIKSYDEAIEFYKDDAVKVSRLTEIRDDEKEHLEELKQLKGDNSESEREE